MVLKNTYKLDCVGSMLPYVGADARPLVFSVAATLKENIDPFKAGCH